MDEELAQQLRALERDRLVELILTLHGRDPVIDREIAAFAARQVPSKHEAQIRSWIRDLTGRQRGYPGRIGSVVGHQLDQVLAELEVLIDTGDPTTTFELAEQIFKAGRRLIETTDDSHADMSMSLRPLAPLWLKAARRCREAGIERDWIAWLEALVEGDGYGLLDELLPNASLLLGEEELRLLAARYETRAGQEEEAHRRRFWLNRMGALARPLRDPRLFLHAERLIEPAFNGARRAAIAECFLDLGDPQGSLEWLETAWSNDEWRRPSLLARAYGALGRTDDQIAVIRSVWESSPTVHHLEELLALLPPEDKEKAREEGRARAAGVAQLETALELLIFLDHTAEAAELCVARRRELKGDSYYKLKELADHFAARSQPLAASLILRALLDSILERGYSRAYHHAADYYEQLGRSAGQIDDWRGEPDHRSYSADLRYRHGRKQAFWSRVAG